MALLREAMNIAKQVIQDTRTEMLGQEGVGTAQRPRLTPKQQVDRFMKLSDSGHEALKQKWGPEQYERYAKAMMALARRGV